MDVYEVRAFGVQEPIRFVTVCSHDDAIPVTSVAGDLVAALCPTCDAQLPHEWLSLPEAYRELGARASTTWLPPEYGQSA